MLTRRFRIPSPARPVVTPEPTARASHPRGWIALEISIVTAMLLASVSFARAQVVSHGTHAHVRVSPLQVTQGGDDGTPRVVVTR
jgi:hypothetical protein